MSDYIIKGTSFYSGQDVLAADLERTYSGIGEESLSHFKDMVRSFRVGSDIVSDKANYAGIWHDNRDTSNFPYVNFSGSNNYDFHITINASHSYLFDIGKIGITAGPSGVAYDTLGRKVAIVADKTWDANQPTVYPPGSTGNLGIDLITAGGDDSIGVINYIYIRWVEIRNPSVVSIHPLDSSNQYIGREDGYIISAVDGASGHPDIYLVNNPDYVYIGYVIANNFHGSLVGRVSDDTSNRYYLGIDARHIKARTPILAVSDIPAVYALNRIVTLEDHIRAIGTGTLDNTNPHALDLSSLYEYKVKATNLDPTSGYLDHKVDDSTIAVGTVGVLLDKMYVKDLSLTATHLHSGSVSDANIVGMDGAKLVNTSVDNSKIVAVDVAKIAALSVPDAAIISVSTPKITGQLTGGGTADSLHTHGKVHSSFIANSSSGFPNFTTGTGGLKELAYTITAATSAGQQVAVFWYSKAYCSNAAPSGYSIPIIYLKIIEGATTIEYTSTPGGSGTIGVSNPYCKILMANLAATTNGGTVIECYIQYGGTGPVGSGYGHVDNNSLTVFSTLII